MNDFESLPQTRQALGIYINYAKNEINRCNKKIKKLENNIQEVSVRLKLAQEKENV